MIKKQVIRSYAAGVLLIVFSLSITPKEYLHDWLSHHKDSTENIPATTQTKVDQLVFHCCLENVVAESPFTLLETNYILIPFTLLKDQHALGLFSSFSSSYIFFSLRGPPVYC